jgi:tetratricopeptide (TPR) repeat protein
MGYAGKDLDTGEVVLQSSTKVEVRADSGATDTQQYVLYQSAEGKVNPQTTVSGKFSYSTTRNMDTGKADAGYKEIILGAAYRPVAMDRLNVFGQYAYKENQAPSGQSSASDIEQTRMQVLTGGAAFELNDKWELVEKIALRIMDEKVRGFEFTKTHTWLLVNRANYRIDQDWKVGAEYRMLTVREARDQKRGVLVEAVRNMNDNMELGVGYNFTNFVDDLTSLDYTVQGPFVRMTGKVYDQSPEERARARQRWKDHRIELYAWKMVRREFNNTTSPIVIELNRRYQAARSANDLGNFEEAQRIYKEIILATQLMYEEAAGFVRKHIAFEENIYAAFQRAQEYFDKKDFWQARKLWEKIVDEASKAVLE